MTACIPAEDPGLQPALSSPPAAVVPGSNDANSMKESTMAGQTLPLELDCDAVQQLLAAGENFLFLDCREEDEYATASIQGTSLLPMSQLQERVDELNDSRDTRIVVHCHHGGRSLRVANWLRAQGFDHAQSMAGGIDAWSLKIDPQIPRY